MHSYSECAIDQQKLVILIFNKNFHTILKLAEAVLQSCMNVAIHYSKVYMHNGNLLVDLYVLMQSSKWCNIDVIKMKSWLCSISSNSRGLLAGPMGLSLLCYYRSIGCSGWCWCYSNCYRCYTMFTQVCLLGLVWIGLDWFEKAQGSHNSQYLGST